jgi:uncharacterized protein YecT (DUF1311 family)
MLAVLLLMALPGDARAEKFNSTVNHGWDIVWNDVFATATHVESGGEIELYRDESSDTDGDRYKNDYTMLSVVGPVVSWSFDWYGEGGAHPTYGTLYRAFDLSKIDPEAPVLSISRKLVANLADLFGEKSVFRELMLDPVVQAALNGEFTGKKAPEPKTLDELLDSADGGCQSRMGDALVTDFGFSYRLDGRIAVVQIGLSHGCEVNRGAFTLLTPLYFPIPEALAEDFERAVRSGALEEKPFRKASFDCNKAGVAIEFAICADPRLAELDVAMGKRYGALRRGSTGKDRQNLKQAQRDWIAKRNGDCATAEVPCLIESYEGRLEALNESG